MKHIILNLDTPGGMQQADSLEDATAISEELAAKNPGMQYGVYALVSESYGEPPEKLAVEVVTKDLEALKAEAAGVADVRIK